MRLQKISSLFVTCILLSFAIGNTARAAIGDYCVVDVDCIDAGLRCQNSVCVESTGVGGGAGACYLNSTKSCSQEEAALDFCNAPNMRFDSLAHCQAYQAAQLPEPQTTPETPAQQNADSDNSCDDCVQLTNPIASTDIPTIIGNTITVVMGIIGSITFVVFVYGGFMWLTSAGSSEKIQKGVSAMVWAGIGIIVVFSSYAIITLILQSLGVT